MKKNTPSFLYGVGQMVKQMREYRGLSQQALADEAGLRQATIADIENGKTNFEINTLVRIATALSCTIDIVLQPA